MKAIIYMVVSALLVNFNEAIVVKNINEYVDEVLHVKFQQVMNNGLFDFFFLHYTLMDDTRITFHNGKIKNMADLKRDRYCANLTQSKELLIVCTLTFHSLTVEYFAELEISENTILTFLTVSHVGPTDLTIKITSTPQLDYANLTRFLVVNMGYISIKFSYLEYGGEIFRKLIEANLKDHIMNEIHEMLNTYLWNSLKSALSHYFSPK
ncbi:uncharacterized protein LOC111633923 [Centruroides sculpturatus]|uniref:uncharacterized protein LOC111633923 n=1 Tax=Centruroides sculpturatus TaxID=218467 RepID=UPI000C6E97CE|nr:uncharacterized protein LOC111633923 [Centruroides sculpturatus]